MMSSGINLVMTVIGFAVSTMFIVFICTRLICARIHLTASRRSFHLASRADLSIMERGLHGLEPVVVSNFPTKKYGDEFATVDDTQCIVCLAEYHHEDVLRILPNCGHSFHANCIDIWLQQHSTCPVCRISLREYSEKKRIMQPLFSSALRAHRGPEQFLVHSPNCVYAGQSYHSRTVGRHHAGPVQEDNRGSQSTITEAQESIATMDDEQSELSRSKKDKHMESPSNGQWAVLLVRCRTYISSLNRLLKLLFVHLSPSFKLLPRSSNGTLVLGSSSSLQSTSASKLIYRIPLYKTMSTRCMVLLEF